VVAVSQPRQRLDVDALPAPICECCGLPIEEPDQQCVARDDGRWAP
jgi:hypothetical protein